MRVVRNANLKDCAAIAGAHVRGWQAVYREHMPDNFLHGLNIDERTQMWRKLSLAPGRVLLVVDDADETMSCLVFAILYVHAMPMRSQRRAIYVSPEKWGQGIGRNYCV